MPASDPQITDIIGHIVFQTKLYVQFLVRQNRIPRETAIDLFSKLDTTDSSTAGPNVTDAIRQSEHTDVMRQNVQRTDSAVSAPPHYEVIITPDSTHPPVSSTVQEITQMPEPSRRFAEVAQPPPRRPVKARALWDWSEKGQESFHFRKGNLIEIIEEVDAEWWYGKYVGKRGYFPSNYVRKISDGIGAGDLNVSPPIPFHPLGIPSPSPLRRSRMPLRRR
ncbi:hypothetical protein BD410DRAFT_888713 [Rickenella mellea]|uniref:SH3 domain-containing protein n=1 Tax=Rickenella mellea TaxID=50990 RepID=A0A4Y7PN68_9AGAM|nr:hypothetical protein BD410DRAFT_888713 [Rickenella mellea]